MVTVLIVILVVLAAAGGAGLAVLKQRRQAGRSELPASSGNAPDIASAPPMSGLEAALDQVAGRSGQTLRDRLEAEAAVVDDLRVPDDTGPVLRRALDRVAHPDESGATSADATAATTDDDAPPAGGPPS